MANFEQKSEKYLIVQPLKIQAKSATDELGEQEPHNFFPKLPITIIGSKIQNPAPIKMKTIRCDITSVKDFNEDTAINDLQVISSDDIVDEGDRFVLEGDPDIDISYDSPLVKQVIVSLQSICVQQKPGAEFTDIQTEIWVDGLKLQVPVSYITDNSLPAGKMAEFVNSILSDLVEEASAKKVLSFLEGNPQKGIPKGRIVFVPSDKKAYIECMKSFDTMSDGGEAGLYDQASNTIFVKTDFKEIDRLSRLTDKQLDASCSDLSNTVFHEFVHALAHLDIIDLSAATKHFYDLLHTAFPTKAEYDRYLYIRDLAYNSKATPETLEEYWDTFVPVIDKYFLYYHAAFSPGEYLSVSAQSYLTNHKCNNANQNRDGLKAIDPVGYSIMSTIFKSSD